MRLVARGRVLLATVAVIVASSSLTGLDGRGEALLYVLGGFWVPLSGWLALNADRHPPRLTRLAGTGGDLTVLFALAVLVPDAAIGVGLACFIVVVVEGYTGGLREGTAVALAATAIVARAAEPNPLLALPFAAVLVLMLLVVERGSSQQRLASLQSERLVGRAGAILERVADGVMVTDARGLILEANRAAHRIAGASEGTMRGHQCREMLGLNIGERALDCQHGCALVAVKGVAEVEDGQEVWRLGRDGSRRPLLANVSAITNQEGNIDEIVHSFRDITSIKQADEAKTLFLATASHELKTPLTVIRGFAELLVENADVSESVRAQAAATIARRADELAVIVDGLLMSSRIEAGRLQLHNGAVQLTPILEERARSLEAVTGRTVDVRLPADLAEVDGDPAAVTTVVDHLLDNAVKYSPAGGTIVVSAHSVPGSVNVAITDLGIGMDAEQAAHCFDKFWQAESTDQRRFRGTGIGLYIVRSLVEAMGGGIKVESAPGRGTTFTISLHECQQPAAEPAVDALRSGDESIVREFMRQIGIPEKAR